MDVADLARTWKALLIWRYGRRYSARGVAHITIPDVQVQEVKKGLSEHNPSPHFSSPGLLRTIASED
jgi:hypothetical protein